MAASPGSAEDVPGAIHRPSSDLVPIRALKPLLPKHFLTSANSSPPSESFTKNIPPACSNVIVTKCVENSIRQASLPSPDQHENILGVRVKDALKPDPGDEMDFEIPGNKFAFSPGQLNKLSGPKGLAAFHALGGLPGLEKGLRTDVNRGLPYDETCLNGTVTFAEATGRQPPENGPFGSPRLSKLAASYSKTPDEMFVDRRRVFGDNRLPEAESRSLLDYVPLKEKIKISAIVFALSSMLLSRIVRTALAAGLVLTIYDCYMKLSFTPVNQSSNYRNVKVIRSGKTMEISVADILVGDVLHLEPGDVIPVDGILVHSHDIMCDESAATGETNAIRKKDASIVSEVIGSGGDLSRQDPFIISGSKVLTGVGYCLVTATGVNSLYGKTLIALRGDIGHVSLLNAKCDDFYLLTIFGFIFLFVDFCFHWLSGGIEYEKLDYRLFKIFIYISSLNHQHLWSIKKAIGEGMRAIRNLPGYFIWLIPRVESECGIRRGRTLPLIIHKKRVKAIPDTGADENVMSTACALNLGLTIGPEAEPVTFRLANGRYVKSCGIVKVSLTFAKGRKRPMVKTEFRVFQTLAAPIIIGRRFLMETKTLSKYDDRLQETVTPFLSAIPRIFHLNAPKQRLRCYLDGLPVYANADTGAEMNLASPLWAAKHGMLIQEPDRGFDRVILADGSLARISGQFTARFQVYGKGENRRLLKTYTRKFYILDGLTSDILLCQDLLLEIKAFKQQQYAFIELNDADSFSDLNFVTWLSSREKKFLRFFRQDPPIKETTQPPQISLQEKLDMDAAREQDRQRQSLLEISRAPESERPKLMAEENQKRNAFLQNRAQLKQAYSDHIASAAQKNTASAGLSNR